MSEFAGFDLDRSIERAWSRFQAKLADHLAGMHDDDILVVEVESSLDDDAEGSAPYVQFCAWGQDLVRSEVSSNAYLAPEHQLKPTAARMLTAFGWSLPTADSDDEGSDGSANFHLDVERAQADRLAVMTTRALRDVFGVAHPAFLAADGLAADGLPVEGLPVDGLAAESLLVDDFDLDGAVIDPAMNNPAGEGLAPTGLAADSSAQPDAPTGQAARPEPVAAVHPRDPDHLRSLVEEALTPVFGHPPEHDEVGDIPLPTRRALIFVRVLQDRHSIRLFSSVAHKVTDTARAAFEVLRLNRDVSVVKFVLVDDRIIAYVHVPADPFAAEHLLSMLATMANVLDDLDHELVTRIGGQRTLDPTRVAEPYVESAAGTGMVADEPLNPAMTTLRQLEDESPGSVTPEVAATVCGDDRDLLLELISWNSAEEIAWRHARDDAVLRRDTDKAEVCDQESRRAESMVNLLRAALRLVVERQTREPHRQDISKRRFPRHGPSPGDATLPGLEGLDEEPGLWE